MNRSKFRLNDKDLYPSSLEVPKEGTEREVCRAGDEEEEQLESVCDEEDDESLGGEGFEEEDDISIDPDEMAPNPEDVSKEQMLIRAHAHVVSARAQWKLYCKVVKKSKEDAKNNVPHNKRSYCFVVYYGQNMEMPLFRKE